MSNNIKALRSGVWYIVANVIMKGIVFFTTPIFTRILSKDDLDYNFSWSVDDNSKCVLALFYFVNRNGFEVYQYDDGLYAAIYRDRVVCSKRTILLWV